MSKQQQSNPYQQDLSWIPSPEEQERINCYYATQLAQEQLRNGTARAQVITYYLKQASPREDIERRMLEGKIRLMEAQQQAQQNNMQMLDMIELALSSLSQYRGEEPQNEDFY